MASHRTARFAFVQVQALCGLMAGAGTGACLQVGFESQTSVDWRPLQLSPEGALVSCPLALVAAEDGYAAAWSEYPEGESSPRLRFARISGGGELALEPVTLEGLTVWPRALALFARGDRVLLYARDNNTARLAEIDASGHPVTQPSSLPGSGTMSVTSAGDGLAVLYVRDGALWWREVDGGARPVAAERALALPQRDGETLVPSEIDATSTGTGFHVAGAVDGDELLYLHYDLTGALVSWQLISAGFAEPRAPRIAARSDDRLVLAWHNDRQLFITAIGADQLAWPGARAGLPGNRDRDPAFDLVAHGTRAVLAWTSDAEHPAPQVLLHEVPPAPESAPRWLQLSPPQYAYDCPVAAPGSENTAVAYTAQRSGQRALLVQLVNHAD